MATAPGGGPAGRLAYEPSEPTIIFCDASQPPKHYSRVPLVAGVLAVVSGLVVLVAGSQPLFFSMAISEVVDPVAALPRSASRSRPILPRGPRISASLQTVQNSGGVAAVADDRLLGQPMKTTHVTFAVLFLFAGMAAAVAGRTSTALGAQSTVLPSPLTSVLEALSGLLRSGDPVDIERITFEQLRPGLPEYIVPDIASLLAREIFRLEADSDLYRKVATAVEQFTQRQYSFAPVDEDLRVFIATNRKTKELAGCVFLKKFKMGGSKTYEPMKADELPLMESLAVDPKYAGRGLGGALVKKCEAAAREWGYDRLMLQVYSENTRAIRFYQRRGYREICEDGTIQRPVSSSLFGIRWDSFDHKVMAKQLYGMPRMPF